MQRLLVWSFLYILFLLNCQIQFLLAKSKTRETDYVKADCLVTNSSLKKCGQSLLRQGPSQCYVLQWKVRYADNKRDTIRFHVWHLKSETYRKDELLIHLKKYQIGQIYPCYHSPTIGLRDVQWEQPSPPIEFPLFQTIDIILFSIIAVIVLSFFICMVVVLVCISRLKREIPQLYEGPPRRPVARGRNTVRRRDRHAVVIPPAPLNEENVPFTPAPPPYVESGGSMENGSTPSLPPPPYVPFSASIGNENIPSTPPPPYVRSSSV